MRDARAVGDGAAAAQPRKGRGTVECPALCKDKDSDYARRNKGEAVEVERGIRDNINALKEELIGKMVVEERRDELAKS